MLSVVIPGKQSTVRPCPMSGSLLQTNIISATSTTNPESHIPSVHTMVMAPESLGKVYKVLWAEIIYQINNKYMEHAQIGAGVITQLQPEYGT